MDMKPSDRLHLRVFAISSRLKEVSAEVSRTKGEAYELRRQLEDLTVAALLDGVQPSEQVPELKARLDDREDVAVRHEMEETRLKNVLLSARRDHLRQLKRERPGRWIVLE